MNSKSKISALAVSLTLGCITQANAASCDATKVQNLVGSLAIYNVVNNAVQTASASTVRVIDPARPTLTKDLNSGSLTIFTDTNGIITSISCYWPKTKAIENGRFINKSAHFLLKSSQSKVYHSVKKPTPNTIKLYFQANHRKFNHAPLNYMEKIMNAQNYKSII